MDRSIPHIRSIFSRKKSDTQDLCHVEKSPRSSRKKSGSCCSESQSPGNKENLKYRTYTSKSLTEKEMKHLERHLSMKKTIRKQISRNLAQAFDPALPLLASERKVPEQRKTDADPWSPEHAVPLLEAEQTVLDLLKTGVETNQSGPAHDHALPLLETEQNVLDLIKRGADSSSSHDSEDDLETAWRSKGGTRGGDTRGLVSEENGKKSSSSIWKVFSPRHRSKR